MQGQMAEYQDDVVVPSLAGEIPVLHDIDVPVDVGAQGIEAGLVQEQHLTGFLPEGADGQGRVQPVPLAGAEQQGQKRHKYEADFRHKNRPVGQS